MPEFDRLRGRDQHGIVREATLRRARQRHVQRRAARRAAGATDAQLTE